MLTSTATEQQAEAAAALRQLIMGFRATQIVHVAAKLGLADMIAAGAQEAPALAEALGADPEALQRLLRALGSLGLARETRAGGFELTALGAGLRRDVPGSLHGVALLYGDEWLWRAYGRLEHSVLTGKPAFEQVHGQPLYAYLDQHPDAARVFNQAMSSFSAHEAAAILNAYNFAAATKLVDVGGGEGNLLADILSAYPHLKGVLFELDSVIAKLDGRWEAAELGGRVQLVAGDFFEGLPQGGDAYLLKSVLHNWDDAAALRILQRCRAAIANHGRLLVIERLIPEGDASSEAKLFDINMLVVAGGRERSPHEYRALFEAAGFELRRIIPTRSALSIVEGLPI
jgi:hypothetical protein